MKKAVLFLAIMLMGFGSSNAGLQVAYDIGVGPELTPSEVAYDIGVGPKQISDEEV